MDEVSTGWVPQVTLLLPLFEALYPAVDQLKSRVCFQEEFRRLMDAIASGKGNTFPGSFKRILEAVDA